MSKKNMKGATLPKEHWEEKEPNIPVSKEKYASEMGNPEDLQRFAEGLASYVRKNKMKY